MAPAPAGGSHGTGRRTFFAAALLAAGLATTACGSDDPPAAGSKATGTPSASPQASATTTATPAPKPPARGDKARLSDTARVAGKVTVTDASIVAQVTGRSIKVYGSATDTSPDRTLNSPLPSGVPLSFLVQERKNDRMRVLLPIRPNQSQGWIRVADVKLLQHEYRMTVSTSRHELTLFRAGKVVMREPVGLGTGTTPTPGGVYYTKELLQPKERGGPYGPYAYGLSGYSEVLTEFLGGQGEIGIHGTNQPDSVGRNVSNGCIRMRNEAITKLARMLPLGVPVQIIA